jgi:hypothetical protein
VFGALRNRPRPRSSWGRTFLRLFSTNAMNTSWALGRRIFPNAVFKNASKRRHPLELKPGMQRPFRLLPRPRDYGATSRLGPPTPLEPITLSFHFNYSPLLSLQLLIPRIPFLCNLRILKSICVHLRLLLSSAVVSILGDDLLPE